MLKHSFHIAEKFQIWLCKKSFTDYQGNLIKGVHEFYVLVSSSPEKINNEYFVRIMPISSKIEMKSSEDILISDSSILGYPFIIETWNEQPILLDLLDQVKGKLNVNLTITQNSDSFTKFQLEFRKNEILNSTYLRQSVLSFLEWDEAKAKKIVFGSFAKVLVAACFIGMMLLIWQPNRLSSKKIFEEYNIAFANKINSSYGTNEILRGNECILPNFSVNECEIIQLALTKYDNKDFKNAVEYLRLVPDLKERDHKIFFYYALSQLYSDDINNAIENLNYLARFKTELYYEDVQYYRALAYIKNKQIIEARKILNSAIMTSGKYNSASVKMLRDLRWF